MACATPDENAPAAQLAHCASPVFEAYWPAGQLAQLPVVTAYCPEAQLVQLAERDAPVVARARPAGHAVHTADPVAAAKKPTAQAAQAERPVTATN